MSNMSTAHSVVKHVSGESKAFTGQRLVKIIAKKDSKGNYPSEFLKETKSVSIPMITEVSPEVITSFMPQILEMFSGFQEAMIGELVREGKDTILDSEIDFAAMAKYLASNAGSARVTKEVLVSWFNESFAEIALEYICTALKWDMENLSPEQEKVLEDKTVILADLFGGFSSGKYSPDDAKCKAMIKFTEFAGDNADSRLAGFAQKAKDIMIKREEELSSNALGF